MRKRLLSFRTISFLLILASIVAVAGCGGGQAQNPPAPQAANVSLSMTDAPPAGVTVISFEVSLTGATLNPGSADLLAGKGPLRIEVKKLETENAFLSTAQVPPGSYTSLNLTFANPELTFKNDTGAALAGCAAGSVCEIKPSGTLTATVNGSFTVADNAKTGLLVDVNLANLFSNTLALDFSAAGALSVSSQTRRTDKDDLEDLDEVEGIIKTPANNSFTLQTMDLGNITVTTDANTRFEDFEGCAAANFSCLADGQSIEADLMVVAGGGFLARKIELEDNQQEANDDELDGVIFKVDGPTQFEIVVIDELRSVANVSVGDPVIVTLQTTGGGTSFRVDTNGLTVPVSLQQAFEGATDTSQLLTGQTVQIRKVSMSGGPAPAAITITTNRVRLRGTRFTATVSGAPTGNNFNVAGLPSLFTTAGITLIQVQTSSQTEFENATGVSGLADGVVVSLRGLLFKSTPNPVLIADKVRKR